MILLLKLWALACVLALALWNALLNYNRKHY